MKKVFTLIELIVIVSVLSILTSMLFTVVDAGIVKQKETQCLDNFKNIGAASFMYTGDHNGFFPVYRWYRHFELDNGGKLRDSTFYSAWRFQIGNYLYNQGTDYITDAITCGDGKEDKTLNAYNIVAYSAYEHMPELWEGTMECPSAPSFDNGLGVDYGSLGTIWNHAPGYYRSGYGFGEVFKSTFKNPLDPSDSHNYAAPLHMTKVEHLDETIMAGDTLSSGFHMTNGTAGYLRLFPYVWFMRNPGGSYNAHGEGQGINVLWSDGRAGFAANELLISDGPNGNDENYYFDPVKN